MRRCLFYRVEIIAEDRQSGINSILFKIRDRRSKNIVFEGVVPASKRDAPGTKRRKRVSRNSDVNYFIQSINQVYFRQKSILEKKTK